MDKIRIFWQHSWKYIIGFLGIAVLLLMVSDFNQRTAEARRLSAERDLARAEVTRLSATKAYLETRIAYVTSDAAVYEWARQDGRMAQPGDNPVVVVTPIGSTPVPTPMLVITQEPLQNWQVWVALFFDYPATGR